MANNLKGFGKEISQSLPYGFTKEKQLLFQFIEGCDVVNLHRLTEGLFELYGDQQMLDLIVCIGKRLPPETFTWLVDILSIEADGVKVESSVNPESCSRPVW